MTTDLKLTTINVFPSEQSYEQNINSVGESDLSLVPFDPKDYAGLPLGHHYAWPFSTVPANSIQCNGATYNRALYADFWQWLQDNNLVKQESEWQSIASSNGGYCPWYSDGDGSTTFRTPKFAPFMQLAMASSGVGTYHQAGLPTAKGTLNVAGVYGNFDGVFSELQNGIGGVAAGGYTISKIDFNLTKSSNIFGRSSTVQPESNEWMICVVVMGATTNIGSADVSNVMQAISQLQADIGSKPAINAKAYVTESWRSGTSWYRIWSDGCIEQGGIASGWNPTVSFTKAFASTNYSIFTFINDGTANFGLVVQTKDKTTTSVYFQWNAERGKPTSLCWYAIGD